MSTIIYNVSGGIEINPDPFLKIRFKKINDNKYINPWGSYVSPSIRYYSGISSEFKLDGIIELPDFNNLDKYVNSKSQEEIEFFQYDITNDTAPFYDFRLNGIYLSFYIKKNGELFDRKKNILEFLNIDSEVIEKAEKLCKYFKSREIVIGRNYDIYFLRRVHTSSKISSGWIFNGKPEGMVYTQVDSTSPNWMDTLEESLDGIYFDLKPETLVIKSINKTLIPVILEPLGLGVMSDNLKFCFSNVNGRNSELLEYIDKLETDLNNRIPLNLTEIYMNYTLNKLKNEIII